MRIVVLVKEVPDTYGNRRIDLTTGLTDRAASDAVADEIGERALEVALAHRDSNPDTEVVVLSMGPATVPATLRRALAMGATRAVHVQDVDLVGSDLASTARVLAAAIRKIGFDLVLTGDASTDGNGGVMAAMLAEHLGGPHVTSLIDVKISAESVSGHRATEASTALVAAPLPAVVSVTEALPEGRFASFKGIVAAKKKPLETWSLADLAVQDLTGSHSIVIAVSERPVRRAGTTIVDDGTAAAQLVDFLAANRLL